jgi:dephospho-CoA kinase
MLNVGLTGGIASGKSTVAAMFQDKGAIVIDFDALARYVEEPNKPAWTAIVDFFGNDILNGDRSINRERLGAIVFRDRLKLAKLNDIVHPLLFKEWHSRISEIQKSKPGSIVISDIPLLIEIGAQKLVNVVVLVYVTPKLQIERLMMRSGCTLEAAIGRLASQIPIDDKIPHAHMIIDNSFSPQETQKRVDDLWEEFKKVDKP